MRYYWTPASEFEGVGALRRRSGIGGRGRCTDEGAVATGALPGGVALLGGEEGGRREGGGLRPTPTYPPYRPF
jgi:hypothetical protein